MSVPTPHNAARVGDIAKCVLMPGDPLRAQFIADTYLSDVRCVNTVRNMLAFTGTYEGTPVTVMGGGMGMPSIGIYSYELFEFYNVDAIIRVGSAGGVDERVELRDVIVGLGACTDSNYAAQYQLPGTFAPIASFDLAAQAVEIGRAMHAPIKVGNVLSSDHFYLDDPQSTKTWQKMGVLAVEMEAAALYMNAARARKQALCLLTVSDLPLTGASLPAEERQVSFTQMMEIALKLSVQTTRTANEA
ncbi:purine-nucleoside phosphorylase [Collinsella sp. zg1085]|uniref:purine-nucleoside phosphorylase n=1 Tax=Collinsella sp. zg1085 TaxID=2844380 RepID=UPI001C0E835F|nr:purine-nucleoside phosphorylase [Collinsella sp. zg1085]QWT17395.1 purine-nucleoside phosphorylase [Collinsella sp. zg1085]